MLYKFHGPDLTGKWVQIMSYQHDYPVAVSLPGPGEMPALGLPLCCIRGTLALLCCSLRSWFHLWSALLGPLPLPNTHPILNSCFTWSLCSTTILIVAWVSLFVFECFSLSWRLKTRPLGWTKDGSMGGQRPCHWLHYSHGVMFMGPLLSFFILYIYMWVPIYIHIYTHKHTNLCTQLHKLNKQKLKRMVSSNSIFTFSTNPVSNLDQLG